MGALDHSRVVRLPAGIDLDNAAQVRAALTQALTGGVTVLVADMTATTWCTLEGLQALLQSRAAADSAGVPAGTYRNHPVAAAVSEPGRGAGRRPAVPA